MPMIHVSTAFIFLHLCSALKLLPNSAQELVNDACRETRYPDLCVSSLSKHQLDFNESYSSASIACQIGMKAAASQIENVVSLVQNSMVSKQGQEKATLDFCSQILSEAHNALKSSMSKIGNYIAPEDAGSDDIWTWMSAVVTAHTSCMDELQNLGGSSPEPLQENASILQKELSNLLTLFVAMRKVSLSQHMQSGYGKRKLLRSGDESFLPFKLNDGLPVWIPPQRRRHLLQATTPTIVVAQDGTGWFGTIQQAVDAASPGNVIYVKKGVYYEYIDVPSRLYNLVIMGDGMDQTIITGNRYYAQVGTTYNTSTVVIRAFGFIGKYLTIQNTAGPESRQAVALLVVADQVAFYKCSFLGYQDTLYTFSYRQFYRECHIEGTVDFIFGNAAAIFQQCSIWARQSASDNIITAQGRTDPNQNTGLSMQQCWIDGASVTYLGRPWKDYSRTVFLQSGLTWVVSPHGWLQWGDAYLRALTVYYGEYGNFGDGAIASSRVWWGKALTMDEASQFAVGAFLGGDQWLPSTGISYQSGLF